MYNIYNSIEYINNLIILIILFILQDKRLLISHNLLPNMGLGLPVYQTGPKNILHNSR